MAPTPKSLKPKRVSVGVSLPPEMAERLSREATARLLAPSVLVEKAVAMLFVSLDRPIDGEDTSHQPEIAT